MTEKTHEIPRRYNRAILVALASIGAMLAWAVPAVAGLEVAVEMNGSAQTISAAAVVVSATVAGLTAWAVKATLERLLRRPRTVWLIISTAIGVLSLWPLTMTTSTAGAVALLAMHVIPAAILIPGLAASGPRKARGGVKKKLGANRVDASEVVSTGSGYGGAP